MVSERDAFDVDARSVLVRWQSTKQYLDLFIEEVDTMQTLFNNGGGVI